MPQTERGIHYEVLGKPENPPVLLIMGLALSSRAWDQLPVHLSRDFHVIVFDNLGTGKSARRGVVYRMRTLARDAAEVMTAAGVQTAHVFGISMGGMIAQELALRYPERVRSLVLGCTFASWRKAFAPTFRTKLDLLLINMGRATPERIGRVLVSAEWHAANPGSAVDWLKRAERTALRYATAQLLAIARHHTLKRLSEIKVPTLILTGDKDKLVPPVNSYVLAGTIPNAKLHVLRGAGHVFPIEREQETVKALREHFLAVG